MKNTIPRILQWAARRKRLLILLFAFTAGLVLLTGPAALAGDVYSNIGPPPTTASGRLGWALSDRQLSARPVFPRGQRRVDQRGGRFRCRTDDRVFPCASYLAHNSIFG